MSFTVPGVYLRSRGYKQLVSDSAHFVVACITVAHGETGDERVHSKAENGYPGLEHHAVAVPLLYLRYSGKRFPDFAIVAPSVNHNDYLHRRCATAGE